MAGFDYTRMQTTAQSLLERFKQGTITLTRTTHAAAANPWEQGSATTTVYTLRATAKGVSQKYIDGTIIVASDLQLTVSPVALDTDGAEATIAPASDDLITIDGSVKAIKRIIPVPAAGTAVTYTLIVEG